MHSWKAAVTSVKVEFIYFAEDGTPLRAKTDLSLVQLETDANWGPQNPTSGTPLPHRTHQVQAGETLDRIAAHYLGSATDWRKLAAANGLTDPLAIRPGQLIAIPSRND
jgi:nucleoid-associated protein YgaU